MHCYIPRYRGLVYRLSRLSSTLYKEFVVLTGRFRRYASTGSWKGQAKWCLHSDFIMAFCRNCSWLVTRLGRPGSRTGGWGKLAGPWGWAWPSEGLSKSSYSREGLRMRLPAPELPWVSIPPPDSPNSELQEGAREKERRTGKTMEKSVLHHSVKK